MEIKVTDRSTFLYFRAGGKASGSSYSRRPRLTSRSSFEVFFETPAAIFEIRPETKMIKTDKKENINWTFRSFENDTD